MRLRALEGEIAQLRTQLVQQRPSRWSSALARRKASPRLGELANHAHPSSAPLAVADAQESWTEVSDEELVQLASAAGAAVPSTDPEEALELLTEAELATTVAGAGAPVPNSAGAYATSPQQTEDPSVRLRPRVERGGVLLPKGRMQIEPSISYSHISNNRVGLSGFSVFDVVFIGEIRSEEIIRDIMAPAVNVRYGVTNKLQAELEIPGRYQREEKLSGPIDKRRKEITTEAGAADMSGGLFYQFAKQQGSRPNMIAMVKVKAPTGQVPLGSQAWGVKSGLLMIKNSDPVVLFSNVGYTINFPTQINGVEVNQGDAVEYSLGLAYALNYNLSLNGSFEQLLIGETTTNSSPVSGSRLIVSNFKTGLTYALTKNLSLDLSVGTGLTEDSPDLTVTVSLPYTF